MVSVFASSRVGHSLPNPRSAPGGGISVAFVCFCAIVRSHSRRIHGLGFDQNGSCAALCNGAAVRPFRLERPRAADGLRGFRAEIGRLSNPLARRPAKFVKVEAAGVG